MKVTLPIKLFDELPTEHQYMLTQFNHSFTHTLNFPTGEQRSELIIEEQDPNQEKKLRTVINTRQVQLTRQHTRKTSRYDP